MGVKQSLSLKRISILAVIFIISILFFYYAQSLTKINFNFCIRSTTNTTPSFMETIENYDWEALLHAYETKKSNTSDFSYWGTKLLIQLTPAFLTEPKVAINSSCRPPPLQFPAGAPPCKRHNAEVRKVAVLLQHGFDADTLEIHFQELDNVVDKFFIIESTKTRYLGVSKPIIWEVLQRQPRFQKFISKVVHFILDDGDLSGAQLNAVNVETGRIKGNIYDIELLQEKMRWVKFLEWNRVTKFFGPNDLLGFGDVDEIPNRNVVHYLKNCEMISDPVDIGIWFPYGRIDQVFRSDYHIRNNPFTLGDPTYWTLKSAIAYSKNVYTTKPPTRNRGRSEGFLLGGAHLTHYGYLPFQLAKLVTFTEGAHLSEQNLIVGKIKFIIKELRGSESLNKAGQLLAFKTMETELAKAPASSLKRIMKVADFKVRFPSVFKILIILPWFYDCNRERYPMWEGKHDTRLD